MSNYKVDNSLADFCVLITSSKRMSKAVSNPLSPASDSTNS